MDADDEPIVSGDPTEVPNQNPEAYCRFCFSGIDVQSVFSDENSTKTDLLARLSECIGLTLTRNADYPSSICSMCSLMLGEFQCFRNRCLKYDAVVRRCRQDSKPVIELLSPKLDSSVARNGSNHAETYAPLNDLLFDCQYCPRQFKRKKYLNQHLTSHRRLQQITDVQQANCRSATNGAPSDEAPDRLSFNGAKDSASGERNISCEYCPRKFTRNMYYIQHLKTHEPDSERKEKPFQCLHCPRSFSTRVRRTLHEKREHPKRTIKNKNEPSAFVCPECSKSFKYRYSLRMHLLNHRGQLPFVCDVCSSGFYNVNYLTAHKARYHGPNAVEVALNERVSCRYCPRTFLRKCDRTCHMKQMHPNYPPEYDGANDENDVPGLLEDCPPADSEGLTDPELLPPNVHEPMMVIKEEEPCTELTSERSGQSGSVKQNPTLYCESCAMGFDTEDMYAEHMDDQHTFPDQGSVKPPASQIQHPMMHHKRAQKLYCQYCSACFSRVGYLNAHMLRVHPQEYQSVMGAHKCRFCPRQFNKGRYRKVHERMTHLKRGEVLPEGTKSESDVDTDAGTGATNFEMSGASNDAISNDALIDELCPARLVVVLERLPEKVLASYQWQLDEYYQTTPEVAHDTEQFIEVVPKEEENSTSNPPNETDGDLAVTQRTKLGIKLHPCGNCSKVFKTRQALRKHSMYHSGELPFRCDECGVQFMRPGQLSFHKARYHGVSAPTIVNRYSCDYCPRIFLRKQDLASHYFMVHRRDRAAEVFVNDGVSPALEQRKKSKRKEYWCQICAISFERHSKCERHILQAHVRDSSVGAGNQTMKPVKLCRCNICTAIWKKREDWLEHLREHANIKPHHCEQCLKRRKKFIRKKMHKCTYCPKVFIHSTTLKSHLRIHTQQLRFPCNECGVMYDRYRYLAMHKLRYHSEDASAAPQAGLHKCAYCPRMFTRLRDVNFHQVSVHADQSTQAIQELEGEQNREPTAEEQDLFSHEFGSLSEMLLNSNYNDLANKANVKQEFPSS
ncbi:zinc finger protein 845-like [Anopheles bellator]|uniref:zinc finger protein 845-like n=1 Tax=Anopheles bellator TaxID=139047 RepID=UPI00264A08AE|nr:zinc finger protein 845-like [Anopheles bellator]